MAIMTRYGQAGYAAALRKLLPVGPLWAFARESVMARLIDGLAAIWADVETRAAALLERESDPRRAVEMLPDWEQMVGLPDTCLKTDDMTIAERQQAVVAKLTARGGQSRRYFIDLAATLGYVITITEFSPFVYGRSRYGDPFWIYGTPGIRFTWVVEVASPRIVWFRYGEGVYGRDPHQSISRAEDLECLLHRWKPDHTALIFNYTGT